MDICDFAILCWDSVAFGKPPLIPKSQNSTNGFLLSKNFIIPLIDEKKEEVSKATKKCLKIKEKKSVKLLILLP